MDVANKICHLCGAYYTDSPFLIEHPGHTPEQCLKILNYRVREFESKLGKALDDLRRAEKTYKLTRKSKN